MSLTTLYHVRRLSALTIALLLACGRLAAETLEVPVLLDTTLIRQLILTQVYQQQGQTARLLDNTPCSSLVLSDPAVEVLDTNIRFLTRGDGRVGIPLGDQCLLSVQWDGMLEVILKPVLLENSLVQLQVVDSNLYDRDMQTSLPRSTLWKWLSQQFYPKLENLRVDFGKAVSDLRTLLPSFLAVHDAIAIQALLDTFRLSGLEVTDAGVVAMVGFDLPATAAAPVAPPASTPEPVLTEAELAQWQQQWQSWDAFITLTIKQAAGSSTAGELRDQFLDILIQARHELSEALTESQPGASDPVRVLFISTWQRLAPLLRQLGSELPGDTAFGLLSFIAAGDALSVIDRIGPGVGLEISTDGLRRLARLLGSGSEAELQYDLEVDPEIRRLFDFGPPLPGPEELRQLEQMDDLENNMEDDLEDIPPLPGLGFLIRSAWATSTSRTSLNNWAPTRNDVDTYAPRVRQLLHDTAIRTLKTHPLETRFRQLFRSLVLATAWQESCWRQYIEKNNQVVPLRSASGAVGMMQVMPKVWRGFYEPHSLETDIAYNAAAGSEILHHYLTKYAIGRREHEKTGNFHYLARATYSAYNGGPGKLTRYRSNTANAAQKEVDQAFWKKYQAISAGKELAVIDCYK